MVFIPDVPRNDDADDPTRDIDHLDRIAVQVVDDVSPSPGS
jgi:hypothetical protein